MKGRKLTIKAKCPDCGKDLVPTKGYKYECKSDECPVISVKGFWRKSWDEELGKVSDYKFTIEKVDRRSC